MPLTSGARLGTYEVLAPLGAGGMGEVYRAKDLRLGREIALKVLPVEMSAHPERLARFEREARTVAALNHPNIVTLHSVEDDGGVRFLTMELVDGQSLDRALPADGLPPGRVVELGIALADALAAAHERGVVHRDFKPANVMLAKDGRVKVLDFGLAKVSDSDRDATLTEAATVAAPLSDPGAVMGTVQYMAPEQLRGETVDARSDLFSLGVVLYELASGRRPFAGVSKADVGSAILRDAPNRLRDVRPGMPADLERIIDRCLQKNARERFQTALDVSNELRHLRRELERGESQRTAPVAAKENAASIAILPFVNRSANADDEYFSDGLADELINVLSKIRGLRVAARSSSFQFKGRNEDFETVGRKLRVGAVLEGSVRKSANRVRINVQLVNVADGDHLWSESYDRTLDDIFAVQDDIARSIVKELRATLLGGNADSDASRETHAEVARAVRGRSTDPEAHRLLLLARHLIDRGRREDSQRALEYLREAVERDPRFVLGWVEIARAYVSMAGRGWLSVEDANLRAREAALRAVSLGPDVPETHARLAQVDIQERRWLEAENSLKRALELDPDNLVALGRLAVLFGNRGRIDEAIEVNRRVLAIDPLSVPVHMNLAFALQSTDRLGETEAEWRKVLDLAPQRAVAHGCLGLCLLDQGRTEEAEQEISREPEDWFRLMALAILRHRRGDAEGSTAALRELIEHHGTTATAQVASVFAVRGEVDAAFEWLDRAYELLDPGLSELRQSPWLRLLHSDPRWNPFLKKLGLES